MQECVCCTVQLNTQKKHDLKSIYYTYIRPVIEQSATVWHSSLTEENIADLNRVQKCAVRVIMGENYTDYKKSLEILDIETLESRRYNLCKKMALKTVKIPNMKEMFPLRKENRNEKRRHTNKYHINKANTTRYKKSAIPYILNIQDIKRKELLNFCEEGL